MKLTLWKRALLGALVALGVAGSSLAPVVAGHASAEEQQICIKGWAMRPVCYPA